MEYYSKKNSEISAYYPNGEEDEGEVFIISRNFSEAYEHLMDIMEDKIMFLDK